MSMICNLIAVYPEELDRLVRHPSQIIHAFFPDDGPGPPYRLDLDKAWHGLHYLLTGDPWEGDPPLCQAILGGDPIGDDTGYGPPRYLTPKEVAEVAGALGRVTHQTLAARYDPAAMGGTGVYPDIWERDRGAILSWLTQAFDDLADFYEGAAAHGMAVLICLS